MATVINTTPATSEEGSAGWAVALVVLAAAIIIGLFVWPGFVRQSAAPVPAGGTNIDVTLPAAPPAPSVDAGAGAGAGGSVAPAQ